jgi:hypothetical protein
MKETTMFATIIVSFFFFFATMVSDCTATERYKVCIARNPAAECAKK